MSREEISLTTASAYWLRPGDYIRATTPAGEVLWKVMYSDADTQRLVVTPALLRERMLVWLRNKTRRLVPRRIWNWWVTR